MAITFVQQNQATNNSAASLAFTANNVAIGDLIVVMVLDRNGLVGSLTPATFTDNVNTGNYTNLINVLRTGTQQYWLSYMVCNAGGAKPTISSATLSGFNLDWVIVHYNGFTGVATYAGSGASDWAATDTFTSSTTVTGPSFNTSKTNELVVAVTADMTGAALGFASGPTGWTNRYASYVQLWDESFPTSGTAAQISGTLTIAQSQLFVQAGFYDATAAPSITIAWIT